jgi:hypothetical protein
MSHLFVVHPKEKGILSMANTPIPVTEQDIESIDALLREMKQRAEAAHKDNKLIIHAMYVRLINLVSPEVVRLHARIEREERAYANKQQKALRKAARSSQASTTGNA